MSPNGSQRNLGKNQRGNIQFHRMAKDLSRRNTEAALRLNRKDLRRVVGLLTGHWMYCSHLHRNGFLSEMCAGSWGDRSAYNISLLNSELEMDYVLRRYLKWSAQIRKKNNILSIPRFSKILKSDWKELRGKTRLYSGPHWLIDWPSIIIKLAISAAKKLYFTKN